MMGVDYDLFWTLNPKSLTPFTKAFSLKQKEADIQAWTQGKYIQMAVASVLNSSNKYPKNAFSVTHTKRKTLKEFMMDKMEDINSNIRKRNEAREE